MLTPNTQISAAALSGAIQHVDEFMVHHDDVGAPIIPKLLEMLSLAAKACGTPEQRRHMIKLQYKHAMRHDRHGEAADLASAAIDLDRVDLGAWYRHGSALVSAHAHTRARTRTHTHTHTLAML